MQLRKLGFSSLSIGSILLWSPGMMSEQRTSEALAMVRDTLGTDLLQHNPLSPIRPGPRQKQTLTWYGYLIRNLKCTRASSAEYSVLKVMNTTTLNDFLSEAYY